MFGWPFGEKARRQRVIDRYLSVLPLALRKKYGKRKHYTADQVLDTAKGLNIELTCIEFAFATFCGSREFDRVRANAGGNNEYLSLRKEIADRYFAGKTRFTIHNVLERAKGRYPRLGAPDLSAAKWDTYGFFRVTDW